MILPRCFDFRDRLNRKGYWHWYVLSLLVIGIGAVIAMMIGLLGFGTPELRLNLILSCYLVTALMVLSIQVPITVQRLHDIGKSGWYALVYLVFIGMVVYDLLRPFPTFLTVLVPFAFVVLIGFVPSEPRKNATGTMCRKRKSFRNPNRVRGSGSDCSVLQWFHCWSL